MPTIFEDTRQHAGKHDTKHAWFESHGIEVVSRKLDFGDYMREGSNVSVDTKRDVQELAMDVGRDHERFIHELERARDAGYRLVVLVEESPKDLGSWLPVPCRACRYRKQRMCEPRSGGGCLARHSRPMQGARVRKIIETMSSRYGAVFAFTTRRDAARVICERLGVEYDGERPR